MKKYITYAMTIFFATIALSFAPSDKGALIAKEKTAWKTFQEKKSDDFAKLLHTGFMALYSDGAYTAQHELDSMKTNDVKSVSFSDFNVAFPDADTATITYRVKMKATIKGQDVSGTYMAASVWRRQNGEWRAIFHTDVKAEKPASK